MADRNRDPDFLQRQRDREFQIGPPCDYEDLDYIDDSSESDWDNDGPIDDTQIWRDALGLGPDDDGGDVEDGEDDYDLYNGMQPEEPEYHGEYHDSGPPQIARRIEVTGQGGEASALCSDCGGRREGVFCPICLDSWSSGGDHFVCCLPCGHVYGFSCIERWLKRSTTNQAPCPQCGMNYREGDIRKLYVSQISVADGDLQKKISSIQSENAFLKMQVPEPTLLPPVEPSTSQQSDLAHPMTEEEHQPPSDSDSMRSIRESIQKHDAQLRRIEAEIIWMKSCLDCVHTHLGIVPPPVPQDPPIEDAATNKNPAI